MPALVDMETSIVGALAGVTGKMAEAETRLKKEVTERKRLHNLVQELKGNIRVFCRVRPMSNKNHLASGTCTGIGHGAAV
ncbi:hypothetical protein T484DRAFT_1792222 [Baffinella frigidus]|nr:hypothetical protein T484DRAFT_1792222 [Cryptophyta sp. CCMP2293]